MHMCTPSLTHIHVHSCFNSYASFPIFSSSCSHTLWASCSLPYSLSFPLSLSLFLSYPFLFPFCSVSSSSFCRSCSASSCIYSTPCSSCLFLFILRAIFTLWKHCLYSHVWLVYSNCIQSGFTCFTNMRPFHNYLSLFDLLSYAHGIIIQWSSQCDNLNSRYLQ